MKTAIIILTVITLSACQHHPGDYGCFYIPKKGEAPKRVQLIIGDKVMVDTRPQPCQRAEAFLRTLNKWEDE